MALVKRYKIHGQVLAAACPACPSHVGAGYVSVLCLPWKMLMKVVSADGMDAVVDVVVSVGPGVVVVDVVTASLSP